MEKSRRRLEFLAPLEIRVHNVASSRNAVEIGNEVGADAILQEGWPSVVVEEWDGQVLHVERGCEDGGVEGRDNEGMSDIIW